MPSRLGPLDAPGNPRVDFPSRWSWELTPLSERSVIGFAAAVLVLPLILHGAARAADSGGRPPITGIADVRLFITDVADAHTFYEKTVGLPVDSRCGSREIVCLNVNSRQKLELESVPAPAPFNLVARITFATPNVALMRRYLTSKGLTPGSVSTEPGGARRFEVKDPEGHAIAFLEAPVGSGGSATRAAPGQTSVKLIHAGFIVRDRQAEDHFYKDILGFHLYWQGGMKEGENSWVSMQVPDGTDWLEYMLNIPASADRHTRGVMNHFALGVVSIAAARKQLLDNGWQPGEAPKIGRDGKWQLNLYDPDETRVEFMEFTPVERPCCSEFTGTHPSATAP
jgi:catechol 2,3-dioxygenase-like lactoylglutathione lyase family enzyme